MHHFFVQSTDINDGIVVIKGDDVAHITRSLRLDLGDEISVSDGEGQKYLTELLEFGEYFVKAKVLEEFKVQAEPRVKVTLVQGLPKSKKMDMIVQKCTEIGVEEFIPIDTKRTVVNLNKKKAQKRQERWQKIVEEAAKQSKRGKIPKVKELSDLKQIIGKFDSYDLVLVPWEDEESQGLKETLGSNLEVERIMIIIGPEGGFSLEEIEQVKRAGAKSVTLGPRILRTETAGIATLSMVLYQLGDLG
ncbi:16S rRNA (uracil1498-N3)-methyltransferase [Orenia metallireducens]|jgi:16S rRNA (uracil1498-N3)-methyltransferase|uniref:Ribosomal RNA small subunit methyltransferase E n=1 Tax=Orenia metallireducens TaxID=1413210 RepID=A0A285G5D1_9FIRM|nr:16S rRNA (uracil(1498)-N(3))-methyltransferase [Orenia metallireducens]PRX28347.1 16S rRNA (uracil1498-N3)-methyltransferase [Orenia metallireducens]SNY18790.1 16S rRNA (uracil1498-N3)-methyltransferase [Orenia metallireducens]